MVRGGNKKANEEKRGRRDGREKERIRKLKSVKEGERERGEIRRETKKGEKEGKEGGGRERNNTPS